MISTEPKETFDVTFEVCYVLTQPVTNEVSKYCGLIKVFRIIIQTYF